MSGTYQDILDISRENINGDNNFASPEARQFALDLLDFGVERGKLAGIDAAEFGIFVLPALARASGEFDERIRDKNRQETTS